MYFKIPAGFHIEDKDSNNVPNKYYLKRLKNCYGTKDAAANWFNVLQKALQ